MSTLKRSKLLMQEDLEERARKKTSSDLRYPRERSLSREQKLPEKKTPIKIRDKYVGGGVVLKGKKVGCQIK